MLSYDLAESEVKFGVLFNNEVMKKVYLKLMAAVDNNLALAQLSQDERLAMVVYTFTRIYLKRQQK